MAKRRKAKSKQRRKGQPGTRVRVKGHTRSPRGSDSGKKAVFVKGYGRRKPRRSRS